MPIREPIFIVGTGRCGSSLLLRMMAEHPRVAFLVQEMDRLPFKPALNSIILEWLDRPSSGQHLRGRIQPGEVPAFWEYHVPGFGRSFRDLRAEDVTNRTRAALHRLVPFLVTSNRPRLLVKLTGWTRLGFIKEVFPDARVVHLIRDPRAVAASLLRVDWWKGWGGPGQWRWGPLSAEEEIIWQQSRQSFVVLAAIQWKKIMEAYARSRAELPEAMKDDVLEVRYEQLSSQKDEVMERILSFGRLEPSDEVRDAWAGYELDNRDWKWREDLVPDQQRELEQALRALDWERYLRPWPSQSLEAAAGGSGFQAASAGRTGDG